MKKETFGQVLKRYRESENYSISKVEDETKISRRMIEALENNDLKNLPDDLYIRNLIKVYAKFLSLDYNKLLSLYEESKKDQTEEKDKPKENTNEIPKVYLTPRGVRIIIIAIIIIALVSYFGWQINKIFEAPNLVVNQPSDNIITEQNFIEVSGETEKEAQVFINDKEVFLDANGQFKATLDLQKGLNIIKIRAAKKHSRENIIYRQVLVQ